jgi:hypothetical protein
MGARRSDSTASLLDAYRADLQRQLSRSAAVDELVIRGAPGPVTLVAKLRVGGRQLELAGTGENVVIAYSDLLHRVPEFVLASAFRQVMEA